MLSRTTALHTKKEETSDGTDEGARRRHRLVGSRMRPTSGDSPMDAACTLAIRRAGFVVPGMETHLRAEKEEERYS